MIDLSILRKDPEKIVKFLKKKDPGFDIESLINLDSQLRQIKIEVEDLRSKKNELANLGKKGVTEELKQQSREVSAALKGKEDDLQKVSVEFKNLYLNCPNIIVEDVPAGNKESNLVVREWGVKPVFDFVRYNHLDLGVINNLIDFESAAKMSGAHFALYKGQGVKLVYALMMHMFNNNVNNGYFPVLPPYLVTEESLTNASNFPKFRDDVYKIDGEDLYLTPTSEVNLTNMHKNNIFLSSELPVRMTSWTSCFRKEAGGYGAQERGLIRLHQFEKVELYTICEPELADKEQERMLACAENILQSLGLHYRVSLLAAQDCSFASSKTYDIEVWMPGQGVYKEVSSISNCTDFQARRASIRYRKSSAESTSLVYTLNGSSLALPRLLVALIETYQQENGTIAFPEVLRSVKIDI